MTSVKLGRGRGAGLSVRARHSRAHAATDLGDAGPNSKRDLALARPAGRRGSAQTGDLKLDVFVQIVKTAAGLRHRTRYRNPRRGSRRGTWGTPNGTNPLLPSSGAISEDRFDLVPVGSECGKHSVFKNCERPPNSTRGIPRARRLEHSTVEQHLPKLLFFVRQKFRVGNRQTYEALTVVDVPESVSHVRDRDAVVLTLLKHHGGEALVHGPLDIARQRPALLPGRKLSKVLQLRIKPDRSDFRLDQLSG